MGDDLTSYRMLLEDDLEHETVSEETLSIPFTETQIRRLEEIGTALIKLQAADASMLLSKVLLWRSLRRSP